MTDNQTSLPSGFESLERFVSYWCHDTNDQRRIARSEASMDNIREFYDAIYALASKAIEHCDRYGLDGMPPAEERLFKLLLAMNHAAIAVEMHGAPRAFDSAWPSRIRISRGPQPFGGNYEGAIR